MPYKDLQKRRESHRRYYQSHKLLYKKKNELRRKKLVEFVISLKQKPCTDCGIQYPHYVMDFDHRDKDDKVDSINQMALYHSYSKENILKEIKKCDLVCANCHRKRTYKHLDKTN